MVNAFGENRQQVMNAFVRDNFLQALLGDEIEIEEKSESSGLKNLLISSVPFNEDYPKSWIIDLEKEKSIFSAPPTFKKAEKALAIFSCTTLYFILFEMKTKLTPYQNGLGEIYKKIQHSISRINLLLPIYIFHKEHLDIKYIEFKVVIVANQDGVAGQIGLDLNLESEAIYKTYLASTTSNPLPRDKYLFIKDEFGTDHNVEIKFAFSNDPTLENIELNFNDLFDAGDDIYLSEYTDMTCPSFPKP
jgi:hypothetical protein